MPPTTTKPGSLFVRTVGPVAAGIAAIGAIFAVLWLVAIWSTDRQRDDALGGRLTDETFEVQYETLLENITEDGAPVFFRDLLIGGSRHIYVNHVGSSPQEGWFAFEAKREGADESCTVQWQRADRLFADPCTGDTYPPEGTGLRQFPTEINTDGDLVIRLRDPSGA